MQPMKAIPHCCGVSNATNEGHPTLLCGVSNATNEGHPTLLCGVSNATNEGHPTLLCGVSNATNEGHPTLLCGVFVSHIVSDSNKELGTKEELEEDKHIMFEVFPVVKEEDTRENKLSDYSIFRVHNHLTFHLTFIIIEVKLAVGACRIYKTCTWLQDHHLHYKAW